MKPCKKTISNPKFLSSSRKLISTFELLLSSSPFSTIINQEHVVKSSSWIYQKSSTYSLSNIPHEFRSFKETHSSFSFSLKNRKIENPILNRAVDKEPFT
ncbi:hypothetical protein Glove_320g136 [Diversispora epigaea]|uniref:Uncharacterized protein n=1 Tax=Diversispora epigaea TaxID=1348612 RepID=A0A397HU62_9GLOM|nr:hypothetical protein Glove_320g136 [Diversispora epigaea]